MAPTITGTISNQLTSIEQTTHPFSRATIGDVDEPQQALTLTITLSSSLNGVLSNLAGGSYNSTTGVYTVGGIASIVTTAINGLIFTPTPNQAAPASTLTTSFSITVSDGIAPTVSDAITSVVVAKGVTINGGPDAALLIGSAGNDSITTINAHAFIYGNGGLDSITLGPGSETVLLSGHGAYGSWIEGQGLDVVSNFHSGVDRLAFDMGVYGITPGSFAFLSSYGARPTTASPTFYYDTSTDYLWFDADGNGLGAADLVAFLPGTANLSASDLVPALVSFAANVDVINRTPSSTTYGEGPNETLWATGYNETLIGGAYRGQFILQAAYENAMAGDGGSFMAGLGGNDQMFGGAGADTFYFSSPNAGVDTIFNFSAAQGDSIVIQGSAFAASAGFHFTDGVGFVQGAGATAVAQTATFAYDTSSGYLWFDPDGTGASSARSLIAFLPGVPSLHAGDIAVA